MPVIAAADARVEETPNAVMTTFAAPSLGSAELAAWEVRVRPGQQGPEHTADREQVWVVLDGAVHATVDGQALVAGPGDTLVIPSAAARAIAAPDGLRAFVAAGAGSSVSTQAGGTRPLPWAA
jgi:quercetin dioxygenase-like cupin family protein